MWKASLRDTYLLLKEFHEPVLIFSTSMLGLGTIYFLASIELREPVGSLAESIYLMLTLTFLQPSGNFPTHPFLQSFYFLMPIVGVSTLAKGLADFGTLFFNRQARNKEWEMAVASTLNKHTVLVGLGHLGYRIVDKLLNLDNDVVVIEMDPQADLLSTVQSRNVPVIQDDGKHLSTLEAAGINKAKTIILCTQNDSVNLQIALKARSINPKINVVIRIFDEDFAASLHDQFGFTALSATEMAAPIFAAAAAGIDITNPISVEGQQLSLARFSIQENSKLIGKTIGEVENHFHVNVVFVRTDHHSEMHPASTRVVSTQDMLGVLGGSEQLTHLLQDNE